MNESDDMTPLAPARMIITRAALADGSLLRQIRSRPQPGMTYRTDAELAASLDQTLASHDPTQDIWVFGYGSLMWNPAFNYDHSEVGTVRGWHRRFCLWLEAGRGTPANPGLMLALDRGGTCRGVAFRIAATQIREELLLIWRREMLGTAYIARWVQVQLSGSRVPAITFVVNAKCPRYAGKLSEAQAATHIATAAGSLGTCAAYLDNTMGHLATLGIPDAGLRRIAEAIETRAAVMQPVGASETPGVA